MTQLLTPPGLCRVCGVFEPFERVILAELLGKPTWSINRSPDFRQRVFNAYGALDDGPLAQQIKNQGWLKYVRARKTGMSDANAHAQAKT